MNSGKTQFEKFLNAYWQNNDPETAMLLWKRQLYSNPQTAGTYLNCLDQIIADPPEELPKIMMTEGWIGLFHEDTDIDYTFEEYLEWLRKMKAEFQKAYDDFTSTPTFLLRELMQYFFLVKSEALEGTFRK